MNNIIKFQGLINIGDILVINKINKTRLFMVFGFIRLKKEYSIIKISEFIRNKYWDIL